LRGLEALDHRSWLDRWTGDHFQDGSEESADAVAATFLAITRRVADRYGTPDLGNKSDPVDELVYIILSRRTREGAYQRAFEALKTTFGTWEEVAEAPLHEIVETIAFGGLGRRKAMSLKAALGALVERFGSCTLDPTRGWGDQEVEEFLCSLPEIGPKSAACVMMCSLDRPAFPVDAHVGRVLERLSVTSAMGIDLQGRDHKFKQSALWDLVPPSLRYSLHVNLLVHGRIACLPKRPRCGGCVLRDLCCAAADFDHSDTP
jgi:endonuclease III